MLWRILHILCNTSWTQCHTEQIRQRKISPRNFELLSWLLFTNLFSLSWRILSTLKYLLLSLDLPTRRRNIQWDWYFDFLCTFVLFRGILLSCYILPPFWISTSFFGTHTQNVLKSFLKGPNYFQTLTFHDIFSYSIQIFYYRSFKLNISWNIRVSEIVMLLLNWFCPFVTY